MADEAATTTDAADESTVDSATTDAAATGATTEGEQALGDAGKQALDRMKAERNEAKAEAKRVADEFAALKAQVEGKQAEHEATLAAQKVKDDALGAANERIKKAEVRAVAAGKLNDPADALKFLDLSKLEVGDDGEVDGDAVAAAIADLIKNKPYLAVQDGRRFQGEADGGARKEQSTSTDDLIAEAEKSGNTALAMRLKLSKTLDSES